MIKINGVTIPSPSSYQVNLQDINRVERNANGNTIIERIATKRKIDMSWNYLSQSDLAIVLQAISGVFFNVEYVDPQDGSLKTGTFYSGDRKAGALDYQDGVMRWKDSGFSISER
ncbi:DUF6711 family protein [Desulfosporosinus lacus]|uniref:Phage tail tube protein n=1 Tax=Desulfosporosinus lacus DSM 15449 TaxID=1121420 RepID=A0A1M5WG35_9FIRM|nr:DUF6711 family protein [Desulfosporosinus lacus]SHH86475.1 hypothetical protein SAMN02746098_01603 [Desulfosporosinus lacus DSM 15449]